MHPQHSSGGADTQAPRRERDPQEVYETDQRALLDLLLGEFPGVLTYREALTAQAEDPEDVGGADRFGSAARGLAAAGLVVRQGELVIPSLSEAFQAGGLAGRNRPRRASRRSRWPADPQARY